MPDLYSKPELYEAAFAWRDYTAEVAVLIDLWQQHNSRPLRRVLDCAAGPAPHAAAWQAAGVTCCALDRSAAMCAHAGQRCPSLRADTTQLPLAAGFDLATTMLGSLYVLSELDLAQHLGGVAAALRPGGLYALDWCTLHDEAEEHHDEWDFDTSGGSGTATYRMFTRGAGLVEEELIVQRGNHVWRENVMQLAIDLPMLTTACQTTFEVLGAWNDWDLNQSLPCTGPINRPLVLLKRT
ncbi:MAG: class I SAM-dependent methyltransferase [Planctomycetota bacterium]|nr:class I SAM-dependent methyltransferase [Planctomycetota bacterium]